MPGISAVIVSIVFMALSIFIGSHFLTEPDTSIFKKSALRFYNSIYEKLQKKNKEGIVGFGYTGCRDLSVDTLSFIEKLGYTFTPQEKTRIITIQDFVETFASFFSLGASTEIFMESEMYFNGLISKMEGLPNTTTFGGNAPHMALRATKESYKAILVADIGKEEINTIKSLDENSMMVIVPVNETREHSDIHLIFEYPATNYKGVKSPKSNKFYLNHDTISPKLLAVDKYLEVAQYYNVSKHAFSGFHLIQKLPLEEALQLLGKVQAQWDMLRKRGSQTIHIEMGAFQNVDLYKAVIEGLIIKADSLGINELEALILHELLKEKAFKTLIGPCSDVNILLKKIFEIIEIIEKNKATLSRLHIHARSMHHLCYRGNNTITY